MTEKSLQLEEDHTWSKPSSYPTIKVLCISCSLFVILLSHPLNYLLIIFMDLTQPSRNFTFGEILRHWVRQLILTANVGNGFKVKAQSDQQTVQNLKLYTLF